MVKHIQILSNPRCASTYMFHLLHQYISPYQNEMQSHEPHKHMMNEPFFINRRNKSGPDRSNFEIHDEHLTQLEKYETTVVMKNHVAHLNFLKRDHFPLYDRFKKLDLYTIVIIRKDFFEMVLSHAIGYVTGEFIRYGNIKFDEKITIDPDVLKNLISIRSRLMNDLVENVHEFIYDEIIDYDDITGYPAHDYSQLKISGQTHIEMLKPIEITQVEKFPFNKRDIVENYDELYEMCSMKLNEMTNNNELPNLEFDRCSIVNFRF